MSAVEDSEHDVPDSSSFTLRGIIALMFLRLGSMLQGMALGRSFPLTVQARGLGESSAEANPHTLANTTDSLSLPSSSGSGFTRIYSS